MMKKRLSDREKEKILSDTRKILKSGDKEVIRVFEKNIDAILETVRLWEKRKMGREK